MDQISPDITVPTPSAPPATAPTVEPRTPKKFDPFNLALIVMGIGVIAVVGLIIYLLTQRQKTQLIATPTPSPVISETMGASPSPYENPFTEDASFPSAIEVTQDASVSSNPFETPPVNPFEGIE